MKNLLEHIAYILGLLATAFMLPPIAFDTDSRNFLFILGWLAIWRYSWGLFNWLRFQVYTKSTFPKMRAQVEAMGDDGMPPHVFLLVTSFRIDSYTSKEVYQSVFAEAANCGRPVTIVASIVERCDTVLIKQVFASMNPPEHVKLVFLRIAGTGKRDALACGFRVISKYNPGPNDVVAVVDGDSTLEHNSIAKCAPLFKLFPKLGALTTDELCQFNGRKLYQKWYNMRFAQRHIFMGSVSQSRRVLTLTGRMSMFRASIVTSKEFIEQIELDWVDHWRLGRFKFLTGDDKTSWYHLLARGWEMLYVPDVVITTIETPPDEKRFVKSSIILMRRWFGNMLRTSGRAIQLGPRIMGFFPWISIVDQRLSMWTALTGLVLTIFAMVMYTPFAIFYYLWWMAFTRYILTLMLLAARPKVSAVWPFLMYYNQIMGSFVKTMVLFRLDKQKWTRQNTVLEGTGSALRQRLVGYSSAFMHVFAFTVFVCLLALISGTVAFPDPDLWKSLFLGT